MKKIVSIVFSMVVFFSVSISSLAAETPIKDGGEDTASVCLNATDKISFANEMDSVYEAALSEGEIKEGTREEMDALMEKATFATETEKETIRQELAQYGIYMYDSPTTIQARIGSGDVSMSTPTIFYESWEKTWTVTCGGNWKNSNWSTQVLTGNVGGDEAFGVGYTNSTNTYKSSVVRASAYITDALNAKRVTTSNRSDGDGSKGFGFRLQDYTYNTNASDETQYVGYQWYGTCTYDSNFGSYNGVATAYYVHTYSKAEVSSVSFGVEGKTAGISATISNQAYSFTAYSSDKTFGTY